MRSSLRLVSRNLVIPHGFTLCTAGVFGTMIGERGYPGPLGIWLFVLAGGLGFCVVAGAAGVHRDAAARTDPVTGHAVFNLAPAAVVPCVYGLQANVGSARLAFPLSGFLTVVLYIGSLAALVTLNRRLSS